ncbi:lysM and putative peptidoglycan-binding domain-containing protein 3 [Onthophagus taurus]|uniref:lysM and putative peptidoglycan-binding domain-containing protein 3 n=1 Tax=Onthophagus taurus TaxID=166361 RepID=UPI000C20D637|nr:lysM and putative peptidoglycan-binding domain-containing protein 3 [Onthophagus taurus]
MKRQKRPKEEQYKKLTGKYSDDSSDETELFIIKKTTYQEPPTVEKIVEEGDTLQAIAIRYRCTVEELKRINHILNANEIFAKGKIKVPERPFSTILAGIHNNSGRSSPKDDDVAIKKEPAVANLIDLPSTSSTNENVNNVIFNSTISNTKTCDNDINENYDEEITLLPVHSTISHSPPSKFNCSGVDADISWITLIVFIVTLIVAVPLIFVFYIAEHHET